MLERNVNTSCSDIDLVDHGRWTTSLQFDLAHFYLSSRSLVTTMVDSTTSRLGWPGANCYGKPLVVFLIVLVYTRSREENFGTHRRDGGSDLAMLSAGSFRVHFRLIAGVGMGGVRSSVEWGRPGCRSTSR